MSTSIPPNQREGREGADEEGSGRTPRLQGARMPGSVGPSWAGGTSVPPAHSVRS